MELKGIIKKFFISFISALIIFCIMPFNHLKADNQQTYYTPFNNPLSFVKRNSNNIYYQVETFDENIRVVFSTYSNQLYLNLTSLTSVNNAGRWFNAYSGTWINISCTNYDSTDNYYTSSSITISNLSNLSDLSVFTFPNGGNNKYYYSFGDGAVGPEQPDPPSPTYGLLKIGFSTSIAYSGGNSNAWRMNKDTIWFDQYDTLGNDLRGLNIELQAVPYSTEASTRQNLLGQKFNEFFYDTVRVGSLGFYSPGQNPIDFTWEYITNRFSPTWWSTYGENWSLTGWFLNEGWYKVGWAYRARVVDDELNTIIDWQWIYNATSVDAQDTENIINNTGYNPDLVNSINNINNINNTTNNNYYNNQTINYNSTEPTSSGSWIEEMIRGIFSTIGTLIEMIGGVFSDLIKGLSDMIVELGIDVLGFFRDIIDSITGNNQQIDLTLPEFNLTQIDLGALNEFKKLTNGYVAIFINSGMWFVIVVPLVLMLLKVVIKWKS